MIVREDQNYEKTLSQLGALQDLLDELEKNILVQLPSGIADGFISSKSTLLDWVEEAEFTLQDYKV